MMSKTTTLVALFFLISLGCNDDFFEKSPKGLQSRDQLANVDGINQLLIGTYSLLDGVGATENAFFQSTTSNWIYGSVASDDAYKGSVEYDQYEITQFEKYESSPGNSFLNDKWITIYDGVARANDVLKTLAIIDGISDSLTNQFIAEARFLRGFFHFEAKTMFEFVPYIDDSVSDFSAITNRTSDGQPLDIWLDIENDLLFAMEHLKKRDDATMVVGRADYWAASAFLAKAYLFQHKYEAAKSLLDEILDSGVFQLLECFHQNFRIDFDNNTESIFEIQMSVLDDAEGWNGNFGDFLNIQFGFHQPSQNLVNAFKTNDDGLPLLEAFNDSDVPGFGAYNEYLDPRVDWTVGRDGIPFFDRGVFSPYGFFFTPTSIEKWVRDVEYGGPFRAKKFEWRGEDGWEGMVEPYLWGAHAGNFKLIRLPHIILWRAEIAVEENDLNTALQLVNQIRTRAANSACYVTFVDGTPAANYHIQPYPSFPNQEFAQQAVRFEERLEFALEGNRFFDLVRWGIAKEVLNEYIRVEKTKRTYLEGAEFDEYDVRYPIPQRQINISGSDKLFQNPGY
jgi:hypothetical protein